MNLVDSATLARPTGGPPAQAGRDLTVGRASGATVAEAALTSLAKRSANRMIHELASPASGADPVGFLCECVQPDCYTVLWLTADAFDRASADPTWHALAPEHQAPPQADPEALVDIDVASWGLLATVLDLEGVPDVPTTKTQIAATLRIPTDQADSLERRLEHARELDLLDRDQHGDWHLTATGLHAAVTILTQPTRSTPGDASRPTDAA